MPRIVFGVSGASGMPLARAVLEALASVPGLDIHLVISGGARRVLRLEGGAEEADLIRLAAAVHDASDLGAGPASGSWLHDGMIVCPCSMSSLAAIAGGAGQNLLHRAADVTLKERRPLVLVARETPLNLIHIGNMRAAALAGATIMPFCPAFYAGEADMASQARQFAGRMLDILRIGHDLCARWRESRESGLTPASGAPPGPGAGDPGSSARRRRGRTAPPRRTRRDSPGPCAAPRRRPGGRSWPRCRRKAS